MRTRFWERSTSPSQYELQNGEVVPKFFDVENMTKALETYKTMYDEGLIPKDFATLTSSDYGKTLRAVNPACGQPMPSFSQDSAVS